MVRDVMDDRKRALVLGKFKFVYQSDAEELETLDKFNLAVVQNKLLGPVQYTDKDGKSEEVLKIYDKERPPGEGYSNPPIDIPGVLDYFVVIWTNPFGDITIDQDIKLFEFEDIQKYSTYNDGPKDKEFCQFRSSSTSTEVDGFDASIFWSVGLLWKHFKTCGVEKWDLELKDLIGHYKNWQEWAHTVHNLPDAKKDKSNKFTFNKLSVPSASSGGYRRSKKRESSPLPRSCLVNDPTKKMKTSHKQRKTSSEIPSTSCQINANSNSHQVVPGQPFTIPIAGANGETFQVQLVCAPSTTGGSNIMPGLSLPPAQPMFSYVNPAFTNFRNHDVSVPPPAVSSSSAWTQNNFNNRLKELSYKKTIERHLVPCMTSSPKRSGDESLEDAISGSKSTSKRYKPKAKIEAPYFEDDNEPNLLDKPLFGVIQSWHNKFGFLKCDQISGKIFLHSKDIKEGRDSVGEGKRAVFQVLQFRKSVVGAKAVNVIVLKD